MSPRILVVDDEPDVQDLIKRRFRKEIRNGDFEFDFALDGQEALDCIEEKGTFDIVLSDINMPRMDGLTLLGHLREHTGIMKTIIVSAYGDMDNIRTAMNRGAFDFVTKPINFDDLSITIDKSLSELKYLKDIVLRMTEAEAVKKYMARELEIGRTIQSGFLPTKVPQIEGWKLTPYFCSAREVAGDFYDTFEIDGVNRIGLIVADVCDKGVGAALFMTLFRSLLRSTAKRHEYTEMMGTSKSMFLEQPELLLKRCVEFTNNYIASTHGHTSMFSTLFFALLDPDTGHLYYINGGHEAPLIIGQGKIKHKLEYTGPVVGLFEGSTYEIGEAQIEKGECLFAYTDGVTDAVNEKKETYTEERLMSLLVKEPEDNLTDTVVREINKHMKDAPQFDDITMLSVSRNSGAIS